MKIREKNTPRVEINTSASRPDLLRRRNRTDGDSVPVGLPSHLGLLVSELVQLIQRGLVAGVERVHLVSHDQGIL